MSSFCRICGDSIWNLYIAIYIFHKVCVLQKFMGFYFVLKFYIDVLPIIKLLYQCWSDKKKITGNCPLWIQRILQCTCICCTYEDIKNITFTIRTIQRENPYMFLSPCKLFTSGTFRDSRTLCEISRFPSRLLSRMHSTFIFSREPFLLSKSNMNKNYIFILLAIISLKNDYPYRVYIHTNSIIIHDDLKTRNSNLCLLSKTHNDLVSFFPDYRIPETQAGSGSIAIYILKISDFL